MKDRTAGGGRGPLPRALVCCGLAAALALCLTTVAQAQDEDGRPKLLTFELGFAEKYREDCWTPATLQIQGGKDAFTGFVELEVPDDQGFGTLVRSDPQQFLPGQTTRLTMYVKPGGVELRVQVRVVDGEGRTQLRRELTDTPGRDGIYVPVPIQPTQELLVSVGPPLGLDEWSTQYEASGQGQPDFDVAELRDALNLPTRWYGYEGVTALVLSTSQPEIYRFLSENSAQRAALEQWIERGGHVVLSLGGFEPTSLESSFALAGLIPGQLDGFEAVADLAPLAQFLDLGQDAPELTQPLRVPRLTGLPLPPELAIADLPLIARVPRGFGRITCLTLDLDRAPLAGWPARRQLLHRLIHGASMTPAPDPNAAVQYAYAGYTDLTVQLAGALDQFQGVKFVAFWVVALLVLLYILLIGPGDFLFVKFVLKRMELTWITFPLLVVGVSLAAYWTAARLKGDKFLVNQVEIVDVDVATEFARATTFANLFSPRAASYDLSFRPLLPSGEAAPQAEQLMSWQGAPRNFYSPSLGGGLFGQRYAYGTDLASLERVPIPVWSAKALLDRAAYPIGRTVTADLQAGEDKVPFGTLTNHLPFDLRGCLLVYEHWAFTIDVLPAGQTIDIRVGDRRDLPPVLKGFQLVRTEGRQEQYQLQSTAYDPNSTNVASILQQMMFYDAGDGQAYTQLSNRYQPFLDLSRHLLLGRAILVASSPQPANELLISGVPHDNPQDQRWTVYRFLLPVERVAAAADGAAEQDGAAEAGAPADADEPAAVEVDADADAEADEPAEADANVEEDADAGAEAAPSVETAVP